MKPVAYSVSKSALVNLTRYLATYWGASGVRVNTLTPHGIENGQPAPFVEAFAARSPLGRLMDVSRGRRRGRLPRLGRVVVRDRRQPRRRRRLDGLVIPAEVPNLVDGEERPPASGTWLEKTRPADGEHLCRVARSGAEDAAAAVAAARAAQPAWGERTAGRARAARPRDRRAAARPSRRGERARRRRDGQAARARPGRGRRGGRDGALRRRRGTPVVRADDDRVACRTAPCSRCAGPSASPRCSSPSTRRCRTSPGRRSPRSSAATARC